MNNTLIKNWNSVVTNQDTVYILGDFCWGKEEDEWIRILSILHGNKVLIRGNHDLRQMSSKLKSMFSDIKELKEINDNGRHVIMCHYPIMFYRGAYNSDFYMLCGHIHITRENDFLEKWKAELKKTKQNSGDNLGQIYNVGCMMPWMNYTPCTLDEIIDGYNTINNRKGEK